MVAATTSKEMQLKAPSPNNSNAASPSPTPCQTLRFISTTDKNKYPRDGPHCRRNYRILIEKRTSKVISRKIRGSRKPRAPRRAKWRKTRQDTGGQQSTRPAPKTQHGRPAREVARPGRARWALP
uniref:Uncharacterized protein n=1 Tax=Opuntia streptacantha TaxID=393608 RepID=A0A7C9AQV0_OPUST